MTGGTASEQDNDTGGAQPRNGTALVVGASIIAAFGGLLFGYDTGVISAALLYIQPEFGLGDMMQQIVVSSILIGAVVGVIIGGPLADRLGRRNTLLGVTVLFTVATLGCALTPSTGLLVLSRGFLGVAIGISSLVVPSYIAEMSPPHRRGTLVSLHQFMVTVGILASYIVGYALSSAGSWRWMLGVATVPAVLMFFGLLGLPESPRWLLTHGRPEQARAVLARTRPADHVDAELAEIREAVQTEGRITYRDLLGPRYRRWISVGVAAAGSSQVVGVNAVIYYAPTILKNVGFGDTGAILASVGIGSLNVLFTIFALVFIDRLGRRPLILGGTAVVIGALILIGFLFTQPVQGTVAVLLILALVVYQSAFACSLGIAIWLVNSEIFPSSVRGKAGSFGIVTHWGLDLLVSISVLTLIDLFGGASGVFWLYAVLGACGLVYLYRWLPETKGRTLEQIESDLTARSAKHTHAG
ncbi:sugar porter family MFS transporter [Saccharopolyspora sp. HNM0983]|uniref:Sugar porter family MFS transporter n=1 Tax=Saccharopolyspora montiporae TaxID=2781240 RepID=A0A929BB03_9PSEU|nr:sugar porter family MFS transporter [Saccharopolyspora sp. HNM0983]MBE9376547.1 sugar porter family MFS transporter [Saccharopolyspora sp. HNM0983]